MNRFGPFEEELTLRGIPFAMDPKTGLYQVELHGRELFISLDNLRKQYSQYSTNPAKPGKTPIQNPVVEFVDAIVSAAMPTSEAYTREGLFWILEPNDYRILPSYRQPVSKQIDRVLTHISTDGQLITWVDGGMLQYLGLTFEEASALALDNLDQELEQVSVEELKVGEVTLVTFGTRLPCKTALILAPGFLSTMEKIMEPPVMAVMPDRDFLYLWSGMHQAFADRLGGVVTKEYSEAPYPLSTEVLEINKEGIKAVGKFG